MHDKPMSESAGEFRADWKPAAAENPDYRCRKCQSADVFYRIWDSYDRAFEDIKYHCLACDRVWWFESSDG